MMTGFNPSSAPRICVSGGSEMLHSSNRGAAENVTEADTLLQPFQSPSCSLGGRWTDSGQQRPQGLLTGKQ
jgi:hypothetical protein